MLPRTALLTRFGPGIRFAGGEAVRRLLAALPAERVRWCCLEASPGKTPCGLPIHRVFAPARPHWRLAGTVLEYLWLDRVQARRRAREIWAWLRRFRPEVLWVLPELSAVNVANRLARLSGLPVHATVHDAHELAWTVCVPRLYMPLYRRDVHRLLRRAASVDAVSSELLDHLRGVHGLPPEVRGVVIPPSASCAKGETRAGRERGPQDVRRIAFCGSFRVTPGQWQGFLQRLATLPYRFAFTAVADPDSVPGTDLPPNVSLAFEPYRESERDLVDWMAATADACYLGVWDDPVRRLFARTSLSSKLVTYAAAGVPVIVDAPADAVAWRLVKTYGAGIRIGDGGENPLRGLFEPGPSRERMREGARRLCREQFDAERNAQRLVDTLRRSGGAGSVAFGREAGR